MALNYNGNAVSELEWNGNPVTTLNFNGIQIQTFTPIQEPYFWIKPMANASVIYKTKMKSSTITGVPTKIIQYSFDKTNWTDWDRDISVSVNVGQKIFVKGSSITAFFNEDNGYFLGTGFSCNKDYKVGGPILSLFNNGSLTNNAVRAMFLNETHLIDASLLVFPTSSTQQAFYNTFTGCTNLVKIPPLPLTTLALSSCQQMFSGCTSLQELPALPATTLTTNCYFRMFYGCTALKFSETQTAECPNAYRIPSSGTGTQSGSLTDMFTNTSGTFTGTPTINTTYYTNATVI